MNFLTLAHAGEEHDSSFETVLHNLSEDPTLLTIVIVAISAVVLTGLYFGFKKSLSALLIGLQAILLAVGVLMFNLLPMLSIVALTLGFGLSLFLVINNLRQS